ncbi:MAG: sulfotransferase family 2 domain-containing protein [Candidatus Marinimicrobia bacterium]|nr:sulfotransferase family 2 domain-containing protein [Candidatus Neomarinimicrobiota bacterium]
MIISHKYKFIFIKTKKTAGTSMDIALSKFCGPDDVITPLPEKDEKLRKKVGGRPPQNTKVEWPNYTFQEWSRLLRKKRIPKCDEHWKAWRVRWWVGRKIWKNYYKFCFERNPWDKAISLYYWRTRNMNERIRLSRFLRSSRAHRLSNFKLYSLFGRVIIDRIYKFENLNQALQDLAKKTNLPKKPKLPRAKASYRETQKHYSDLIDPRDKKFIANRCSREIDLLNYKFEDK